MTYFRVTMRLFLVLLWDMGAWAEQEPKSLRKSLRGSIGHGTWLQEQATHGNATQEAKLGQPDARPWEDAGAAAEAKLGISLTWGDPGAAAEAKLGQPDARPKEGAGAVAEAKLGQPEAWPWQEASAATEAKLGHADVRPKEDAGAAAEAKL